MKEMKNMCNETYKLPMVFVIFLKLGTHHVTFKSVGHIQFSLYVYTSHAQDIDQILFTDEQMIQTIAGSLQMGMFSCKMCL